MTNKNLNHRRPSAGALAGAALTLALAACGGGDPSASGGAARAGIAATDEAELRAAIPAELLADTGTSAVRATTQSTSSVAAEASVVTTTLDAVRLANQATFGATVADTNSIRTLGPKKWIARQMLATRSVYPDLGSDVIHKRTTSADWCTETFAAGSSARNYCWRDYYTATPIAWHFYRQAVSGPDQLRQRVAFALSQWLVVSDVEVFNTYGLRDWHQMLRDRALGNYRTLLREVILSPVMGAYLNNVDNGKTDPNENFARELLQLFSIGTCELNADGTLKGGSCQATYDNAKVREYAYALSGWTYPAGGYNYWCPVKCGTWRNPPYFKGQMVAVPAQHDTSARSLLSGVTVAAGATPEAAVERVLDSIMNHPNVGPFVATRLIRHLVTSNPSPAYVQAVATAFDSGDYQGIGTGMRGDLAATVAAVLLHPEARDAAYIKQPGYGRLREPVQAWTSVMRALDARTDGIWFAWSYGKDLGQSPFSPPSVFSYYEPGTPLVGTSLVAPAMGIENESSTLQRMSLLQFATLGAAANGQMVAATPTVADSTGTFVSHDRWLPYVADSAALVSKLTLYLTANQLTGTQKAAIVAAIDSITPTTYGSYWQTRRIRVATYLVMMTPQFSIVR
ncbi:DUF1800 domain-containing protein [Derxia gummosa]|uniref:DUF1800 domain-containing protein n=1 Tax=Derxia gummosa DSM 723 TaxID=1121388 RepID=A0A8B6X8H2_9BURK|nr:DUF1800 domain-containing protein [Derxia gummosa]